MVMLVKIELKQWRADTEHAFPVESDCAVVQSWLFPFCDYIRETISFIPLVNPATSEADGTSLDVSQNLP
jgi:hypothetical protein